MQTISIPTNAISEEVQKKIVTLGHKILDAKTACILSKYKEIVFELVDPKEMKDYYNSVLDYLRNDAFPTPLFKNSLADNMLFYKLKSKKLQEIELLLKSIIRGFFFLGASLNKGIQMAYKNWKSFPIAIWELTYSLMIPFCIKNLQLDTSPETHDKIKYVCLYHTLANFGFSTKEAMDIADEVGLSKLKTLWSYNSTVEILREKPRQALLHAIVKTFDLQVSPVTLQTMFGVQISATLGYTLIPFWREIFENDDRAVAGFYTYQLTSVTLMDTLKREGSATKVKQYASEPLAKLRKSYLDLLYRIHVDKC